MQSNSRLWLWVSRACGRSGSLCPGITQRRGESEPWAQDLASPPASTAGRCLLGSTAPQQSHHLIQLTVRKAFGRAGDMSTGKAKVPMENHLEGRGSLSITRVEWQRQQEDQAGTIPAPEPNFGLKVNPFTCQDISTDGNSVPTEAARVSRPSHKLFVAGLGVRRVNAHPSQGSK